MTTPAGWYDDPNDSNAQRYWDGQDWTPHRQRKPIAQPAPQPVVSAPTPPPPAPLPPPSQQQPQWSPPGPTPNAPPRKRSRAPLVVAAVVAIAALAVAGVFGYKFLLGGKSDEDQIKALVQNVTTHQNNADGPGLLPLMCTKSRGQNPATSQMLRSAVDDQGTSATTVTEVRVTGDHATATVTTTRSKYPEDHEPETWAFVKENGTWTWCGRQ